MESGELKDQYGMLLMEIAESNGQRVAELLGNVKSLKLPTVPEKIAQLYLSAGIEALKIALAGDSITNDDRIKLDIVHAKLFQSALQDGFDEKSVDGG